MICIFHERINQSNPDGVSVGLVLNETNYFLKQADSDLISVEKLINDVVHEGVLFHSSQTRICHVNGSKLEYSNSGDLVKIKNKKIFIQGRVDNCVKLNGKLVDLTLLEMVIGQFIRIILNI